MKVFLCENIHPKALELLKSRAEVVSDWSGIGSVDAIINRNLKLPRDVLSQAPNLRVIAIHGTGSDGIDMDFCNERGITVLYVPLLNADSVAELIVTLTLSLLRKIPFADREVISGRLKENAPAELFGNELRGKTIGLIGVGDIARRAARIMISGFDCCAVGYDPYWPAEKVAELQNQLCLKDRPCLKDRLCRGIERCDTPHDVMRRADVISIGVHLTDSTANMINDELFSLCKPTAVLVNTSRGGVVDEAALYRALKAGRLAAAACDVWQNEPPTLDNPLVGLPNVIATPHLGANTDEALERVGTRMVEQIFTVLDGGEAEYTYK